LPFGGLVLGVHLNYYVTKGNVDDVHHRVHNSKDDLGSKIAKYFDKPDFSFKFLGARDLLDLARRQSSSTLQLALSEYLPAGNGGVIGLVKLWDYYRFITDSAGRRLQPIFDANVRDYAGDVDVNRGIRETLEKGDQSINFWWLNNGITVVASRAPVTGKVITLENPKVVNGLQTSQELYDFFTANPAVMDERELLVRVIVTKDEEVRNQVIKATNSQTRIAPEILRATEQIHRDIEQDFHYHGLFYDRQKNYYKNLGKPRAKIVTIKYLAQAVAAMLLQEPNNSRGRPTNLLNDEASYRRIFSSSYDISIYRKCAMLMKTIDDYLRRDAPDDAKRESTNLRWQMAMFVSAQLANTAEVTADRLAKALGREEVDYELLTSAVHYVYAVYAKLKTEQGLDGDRIAKNKDYDKAVLTRLKQLLNGEAELCNEPQNLDR